MELVPPTPKSCGLDNLGVHLDKMVDQLTNRYNTLQSLNRLEHRQDLIPTLEEALLTNVEQSLEESQEAPFNRMDEKVDMRLK